MIDEMPPPLTGRRTVLERFCFCMYSVNCFFSSLALCNKIRINHNGVSIRRFIPLISPYTYHYQLVDDVCSVHYLITYPSNFPISSIIKKQSQVTSRTQTSTYNWKPSTSSSSSKEITSSFRMAIETCKLWRNDNS